MTDRAGYRILLMALFLSTGGQALAHALQPGYLGIAPDGEHAYRIVWKKPAVRGRPMAIDAQLPANCSPRRAETPRWTGSAWVAAWRTECPGGIEGGEIRITGLERTVTDVLVRIDRADGEALTHRLDPERTAFIVPATPSLSEVVRAYLQLGIQHILGGVDHLLFVLALLLLVDGMGRRAG